MWLNHAKRAAAARDLARQARRLANGQTAEAEKNHLTRYAEELETEASILEGRANEAGKT